MSNLLAVDVASFDRSVLTARGALAVLFSAQWCGPCRSFAPLLERVAGALDGGPTVVKIDCDASPELAVRFGVRSVPTLVLLRAGEVAARHVGTMSEPALRRFLDAAP